MLKAILVTKATLAARTPAPPLMPQNQGIGQLLIVETNRMPVGNPKPIRKPAGARTRTQRPARTRRFAPSRSTKSGATRAVTQTSKRVSPCCRPPRIRPCSLRLAACLPYRDTAPTCIEWRSQLLDGDQQVADPFDVLSRVCGARRHGGGMDRFIRAQNVQRYRSLLERWSKLVRQTVFDWPNLRIQALRTEADMDRQNGAPTRDRRRRTEKNY